MISYLSINIKHLSINFVGNKVYEEGVFLSKQPITDTDDLAKEALIRYFIDSFTLVISWIHLF